MEPFAYYNDPRYASMYGYVPQPQQPSLFGVMGTNPGLMGGLLQSFAPMLAEQFRIPMGVHGFQFGSDMNAANIEFSRNYMRDLGAARTKGADIDAGQLNDMLRGFARIIGHEGKMVDGKYTYSPDVEAGMKAMSRDVAPWIPMLAASFPDEVDRFLPRGSMTVAAQSFVNAGRFIRDPVTGRPVSENPNYGTNIMTDMLAAGPKATSGLRAGQMGRLYEGLVGQGIIGSSDDLRLKALASDQPMDAAVFGETEKKRVEETLTRYSGSIAAINDIFKDQGINAPMPKLINALQKMTQGGMATYSPEELTRIAREYQATTKLSGMDAPQLDALTGLAGQQLRQAGSRAELAPIIAMNAALAGKVYAGGNRGLPTPEGMSRDEFVMEYTAQQTGFAGSAAGNLVGALFAKADLLQGADTPLTRLAAAMRKGQTAAEGIDIRTATPEQFQKLFQASGLGAGDFLSQITNTRQNQAFNQREGQALVKLGPQFWQQSGEAALWSVGGAEIAGLFPTAAGQDQFMKDFLLGSQSDWKSDNDFARWLAKRQGRTDAESVSAVGNVLGRFAAVTEKPSGFAAGRLMLPGDMAEGLGREAEDIKAMADEQARLTHIRRGGLPGNFASTITGLAGGATTGKFGMFGMLVGGTLGAIPQEDIDAQRGKPYGGRVSAIGNVLKPIVNRAKVYGPDRMPSSLAVTANIAELMVTDGGGGKLKLVGPTKRDDGGTGEGAKIEPIPEAK